MLIFIKIKKMEVIRNFYLFEITKSNENNLKSIKTYTYLHIYICVCVNIYVHMCTIRHNWIKPQLPKIYYYLQYYKNGLQKSDKKICNVF